MKKPRRYMTFRLSIYDTLTDKERYLYDSYKKCKPAQKEMARNSLIEEVKKHTVPRKIDADKLYVNGQPKEDKVIARFEDECVRQILDTWDNGDLPFVKEVAVMECSNTAYTQIMLAQIVKNGIMIAGEKYIFYSSSANQQKNKQVCLMQEEFYHQNEARFMCGLTREIINERGGCNTGKYLAYTSLIFSKSVVPDIPVCIDEVIVLPEFQTEIMDTVNYLQMENLSIEKLHMPIPVNHMDGAGIFIPGTFEQSCQIRGGWIKGAVFPFDFRQFIIEKQEQGVIALDATILDAWENPVSINHIRDNIKLILNASQLKMWKFYNSWDDYCKHFKANGLSICVNNMLHYPEEEDPMVQSAYQFFQTIPRENFSQQNIEKLCAATIAKINAAKEEPAKAMEVMGIDMADETAELDPFYASIRQYPELLQTEYVQKRIKKAIESMRNTAMSGKPDIQGYYSYICPDLYAACEHWLCGIDVPEGLIPRGHVYNSLYANTGVDEVCCLRSPHLSDCEHGIRKLEKSAECERWFPGMDTVISTHDLLLLTLQADADGDELLVTPDKAFLDLLDREKVPLYYQMQKAPAEEVTDENIFHCLIRSFQNSVIGEISNTLTKYLNLAEEIDLDFVRILTAYNNFCIDFPKSQYMPEIGQYQEMFDEWKDREYPYFFKFAKCKKNEQCCMDAEVNERSNIYRLSKYIQGKTRATAKFSISSSFNPGVFEFQGINVDAKSDAYRNLQMKLIELDRKKKSQYQKRLNEDKRLEKLRYDVFYHYCNYEIMKLFTTREAAAAYLFDIEYRQEENAKKDKDILWNCFGEILYENLKRSMKNPEDIKIRKNRYQSELQKQQRIYEEVSAVAKELSESIEIPVYQDELEWIQDLKCNKNCQHDRYLLYVLMILYKRKLAYAEKNSEKLSDESKKYFRIYKNAKGGKVTRNTIDTWLGHEVAKKGLVRLQKKNIIRIETCKDYDKIYVMMPVVKENHQEKFMVKNWNPMIDYYKDTDEAKIKKCEICGQEFIAVGAAKTCSAACSRKLELRNKNK